MSSPYIVDPWKKNFFSSMTRYTLNKSQMFLFVPENFYTLALISIVRCHKL